jgi:hypothetical protein
VILRQPAVVVAVLAAAVGYGVMNLLMSATPLAMDLCCHHPFAAATFVLQWHVIGMFAPSFFVGGLIRRVGVLNVLLTGAALLFVCVGIAMSGVTPMHFWWALTLLGVGWNFLYVAAPRFSPRPTARRRRRRSRASTTSWCSCHGQLLADGRRGGDRKRRLGAARPTHRALPRPHQPCHVHSVAPRASDESARLKARPRARCTTTSRPTTSSRPGRR